MIADRDGLYLRVRSTGSKPFVFCRTRHGRPSMTILGEADDGSLSLKQTRDKVRELNGSRRSWSKMPFADLLDEWFDESIDGVYKRPHHVRGYLNNVPADLGQLRLMDIERADVTRFFKKYNKTSGPVGANRFLASLKQAFNYAVEMGYINTSPISEVSRRTIGGIEKTRDRSIQ